MVNNELNDISKITMNEDYYIYTVLYGGKANNTVYSYEEEIIVVIINDTYAMAAIKSTVTQEIGNTSTITMILNEKIKKDCDKAYKIYIYVEDYLESMAIAPVQRSLNNISFAVNTNYGNPKGSLILAEKVIEVLKEYDEFIGFSSLVRKSAKAITENKSDIINFVCSEDFKYIYEKKKDKLVLEMFFKKEVINKIYRNL